MPPSPSRRNSKARVAAYRGGHRGEALAAWYLRLKFYTIIARRAKTPLGEIDLIASRLGTTVFVEVKARATSAGRDDALAAVNQARIVRAAQYWLTRHPERTATPLRFDVIFVTPWRWPYHLANAFGA